MNVTIHHEVRVIQNKLSSTLDGIMMANREMKNLHEKYQKHTKTVEGFDAKNPLRSIVDIKCNFAQETENNWILYSSILAVLGGLYFLSRK